MHRFIPPRPFLDMILWRVAILWLVLRVVAGFAAQEADAPGPTVQILSVGWIWLVVVIALKVDLSRRHESVFLANLGHSFPQISILAIGECVVFEMVARVFFV